MLRTVYLKTLRDYRRSLFFWVVSVVAALAMYSSLFPSIAGSQDLVGAFENLPDGFAAIIGDITKLGTPEGFITSEYLSLTYPLLLAIMGISAGSALLSKEEESGTIELLLASGLSRTKILLHKYAALLTMLIVLGLAGIAGMSIGIGAFNMQIDLVRFSYAMLTGVLLGSIFGTLAFTVTAMANKRGLAIGLASLVFIASYMITTLSKLVESLQPYATLSPLHYYDGSNLLYTGPNYGNMAILAAISGILLILARFAFRRRDIS